jgi:hypothetical protein
VQNFRAAERKAVVQRNTNCLTKGRKLSFQKAAKRLSPYNILQLQGYFELQTAS